MSQLRDIIALRKSLLERFPDSQLKPLSAKEIKQVQKEHPAVPKEYLDILATLGWGTIGKLRFQLYSGLVAPSSIYDATTAKKLAGVLLIGDDYSGYCVGYHTLKDWKFGEISSNGTFRPCLVCPKTPGNLAATKPTIVTANSLLHFLNLLCAS